MKLSRWGAGENLGGIGEGKNMIKICYLKTF